MAAAILVGFLLSIITNVFSVANIHHALMAHAEVGQSITVSFEATVDQVTKSHVFNDLIKQGDKIIGSYTYNSSAVDTSPDNIESGTYAYVTPPNELSFVVNGLKFSTNPQNLDLGFGVTNKQPGGVDELLLASTGTDRNLPVVAKNRIVNITEIGLYFIDRTGNAISNDSLPISSPSLNDWKEMILFADGPDGSFIGAHLISISMASGSKGNNLPSPGTTNKHEIPIGFNYTINNALMPNNQTTAQKNGTMALEAVKDSQGLTSTFVANEVIYQPKGLDALNNFLTKYNGRVIQNLTMTPPLSNGTELHRADNLRALKPTYRIALNSSALSIDDLDANMAALRINQTIQLSSLNAARMLALQAREKLDGNTVKLDFFTPNQGWRFDATTEEDRQNAMAWTEFNSSYSYDLVCFGQACFVEGRPSAIPPNTFYQDEDYYGVKAKFIETKYTIQMSNVNKAWRFVAAHDIARPARVAIIDNGFWLDSDGHPFTSKGGSDLPPAPMQYDFTFDIFSVLNGDTSELTRNRYSAGGPNPQACSGGYTGPECKWHGNHAASVATGKVSNGYQAAGTGGTVSEPMLFRASTFGEKEAAVRTAVAWGADIISISSGGECNWWCEETEFGNGEDYSEALDDAHAAGVLVIASAGNSGLEVNENDIFPCTHGYVLCIGALENSDGQQLPWPHQTGWSSNYGNKVQLYAPTDIQVEKIAAPMLGTPDSSLANGEFTRFSGTSASAPFVAGVAAMVKAINPGLSGDQVKDILLRTSIHDRANINHVNAFDAVVEAAGGYHIPPFVAIITPAAGSNVPTGTYEVQFSASVMDPMDDDLPDSAIQWTSNVDGFLGSGHALKYNFANAAEGPRTITVTATNRADPSLSATDSVTINLKFAVVAPTPRIIEPNSNVNVGVGTPITLKGQAKNTDPLDLTGWIDCKNMFWTITDNTSGQVEKKDVPSMGDADSITTGVCSTQVTLDTPGEKTITLTAHTNKRGWSGTSSVNVNAINEAPFDFSLSTEFQNYIMQWGQNITIPIDVNLLAGTSQPVTLEVSGAPAGVKAELTCGSGSLPIHCVFPPYKMNLVLSDINTTAIGTYPITITATTTTANGQVKHSITVILEIQKNIR
jgi:hypothetical protein